MWEISYGYVGWQRIMLHELNQTQIRQKKTLDKLFQKFMNIRVVLDFYK